MDYNNSDNAKENGSQEDDLDFKNESKKETYNNLKKRLRFLIYVSEKIHYLHMEIFEFQVHIIAYNIKHYLF